MTEISVSSSFERKLAKFEMIVEFLAFPVKKNSPLQVVMSGFSSITFSTMVLHMCMDVLCSTPADGPVQSKLSTRQWAENNNYNVEKLFTKVIVINTASRLSRSATVEVVCLCSLSLVFSYTTLT